MTDELPRNIEAERALIGSVIMAGQIDGQAEAVKADYFSDRVLAEIWKAIIKLQSHGDPLDVISIAAALKGCELIPNEAEATALLAGIIGETPSHLHLDKYAELIMTTAAKRKIAATLPKIARLAYGDGKFDPADVIAEAMDMIEKAGDGFQPIARERWTGAELAALEVPDDPFLLDGLLVENALNLVAGEFSSGKTFACLDLALGAASGGMAWGRKVKPSKTLYFGADNSRSNLVRRIRALSEGRGIDAPHDNLVFDLSPLNLSEPAGIATIRHAIIEYQADLVIVDAIIRYLGSYDENSAADIGRMMAGFRDIANTTGATFILIHHLRKLSGQLTKAKIADRIRGSGDFMGAVDSAVVLTTKGEGSQIIRNVTHVKCREAEESNPLSFEIHEGDSGGLVLSFGLGDAAMAAETLAEIALDTMVSAMQKEPGVAFTKSDLRGILDNVGLNLSSRTEDDAFSMIRNAPNVQINKVGRFNNYQWIESEK